MSTAAHPSGSDPQRDARDATSANGLPALEQLPDDPATLKSMILELLATLQQERRDYESVRQRLDLLLRRLYGPRTERFDPNQPLLFPEMAQAQGQESQGANEAAAEPASAQRRATPHGRRRLPEHLPREPRHHELTPAERVCPDCGQVRHDIGVDKSEQLEYRPASLIVIEHIVHKYACPCCSKSTAARCTSETLADTAASGSLSSESTPTTPAVTPAATPATEQPTLSLAAAEAATPSVAAPLPSDIGMSASTPAVPLRVGVVITAPRPASPIAKGLPGPGLLAHLIVSKYVDHMPLYRLERSYERQGFLLPRSTTCDWLAACAEILQPLYVHMVTAVCQSRALHTDDTTIKNQEPPPNCTDLGRMWCYLGDAAHPFNVFDFTPNRKRDGPQHFLANFQGYLHADAFSGYDALYLPRAADGQARIFEVACNAHGRRKFYDARSTDAARSHQALAYYTQLYEIERRAKANAFDDEQRRLLRQELALPILNQFRAWLDAERVEVLPKSPMAEAIGYALNNWTALTRYTEAGFLTIDNNIAEREMKRIAIGRKNWLFVGSVQGGETAAVLISFTSTCHRLGIEPWSYLQDILARLPELPADRLAELLPDRWLAARRVGETSTPTGA